MRIRTAIACLTLPLWASAAAAATGEPIGSAVTVVNYVTASLDADLRQLSTGDDVRQQELIEVDPNGRSELELNDRTKLALGPGSRLLLDRFVYDPDLSGGAIVMDLIKGTFRFMTGIAAKPAYVIRTPVAAITVRGTIFDVFVVDPSETWLLLSEGAVEVCVNNGNCLLHDEPGKIIRITRDDIDAPSKWAGLRKGDIDFDDAFPFIVDPPGIDPDPIYSRADIVSAEPQEQNVPVQKVKPKKIEYEQPYTPPPPKVKKRQQPQYEEYRAPRTYPRRVYLPPKRKVHYVPKPRGRGILKKAAKAGAVIGVGVGVGYGLAKILRRKY